MRNATTDSSSISIPRYVAFVATRAAQRFVDTPRFGHSQDFAYLFGSKSQVKNYSVGLIIGGSILFAVFVMWAFFILLFMCLGHKRVGFLSGFPFHKPEEVDTAAADERSVAAADEQSSDERVSAASDERTSAAADERSAAAADERSAAERSATVSRTSLDEAVSARTSIRQQQQQQQPRNNNDKWLVRPTIVRSIFLICGVAYILFAILLVTQGLTNLQNTVSILHTSAVDVNEISLQGKDILNSTVLDLFANVSSVSSELQSELENNTFCPADPSLQNSSTGSQVRQQADQALSVLQQLDAISRQPLDQLIGALDNVHNAATSVEDRTANIELSDWQSLVILIPYILVPSLLMGATIMAICDMSFPALNCVISWILLPLFVLMAAIAWIWAAVMLMGSGGNSDFCLPGGPNNSPDTTMLNILLAQGFSADAYLYGVVLFYISQCRAEGDPLAELRAYLPELISNQQAIYNISSSLGNDDILAQLSLYCNRDFNNLQTLVSSMQDNLIVLTETVLRTLDLMECDKIVGIYTQTVYVGTCQYSVKAMAWMFASALILGITGMAMITFRASYKRTIIEDELLMNDKELPVEEAAAPTSSRHDGFGDEYVVEEEEEVQEETVNYPCASPEHSKINVQRSDSTELTAYDYDKQMQDNI